MESKSVRISPEATVDELELDERVNAGSIGIGLEELIQDCRSMIGRDDKGRE